MAESMGAPFRVGIIGCGRPAERGATGFGMSHLHAEGYKASPTPASWPWQISSATMRSRFRPNMVVSASTRITMICSRARTWISSASPPGHTCMPRWSSLPRRWG